MLYFPGFTTEIKEIIATAVGLKNPSNLNLVTSVQAASGSFVNELVAGEYTTPLVVIEFGEYVTENNLGIDNWALKRTPITLHYVTDVGGDNGNQDYCFQMALNLILTIDDPSFKATTFEPFESGDVLSGLEAPINRVLLADSEALLISSAARWKPGWLINFLPQ